MISTHIPDSLSYHRSSRQSFSSCYTHVRNMRLAVWMCMVCILHGACQQEAHFTYIHITHPSNHTLSFAVFFPKHKCNTRNLSPLSIFPHFFFAYEFIYFQFDLRVIRTYNPAICTAKK